MKNAEQIRDWFEYIETETTQAEPVKIDQILEEKMQRLLDRRLARNLNFDEELI